MTHQIEIDEAAVVHAAKEGGSREILTDVASQRPAMVHVVFIGEQNAGDRNWVLIDAGIPFTAGFIRGATANTGGQDRPYIFTSSLRKTFTPRNLRS